MNGRRGWLVLVALFAIAVIAVVLRWNHVPSVAATDAGVPLATTSTAPDHVVSPNDTTLPRGSIAGRVVDETAKGIAGARVCAFASSDKLVSAHTDAPFCTATDGEGRYRIGELFGARYRVSAAASQREPTGWRDADGETSFLLAIGAQRTGIDIVLAGGGVLVHGHVRDIAGGPIAQAIVAVSSGSIWERTGTTVTQTNAIGDFEVWAKAGDITATATADGYNEAHRSGIAPGQRIEVVLTPESVLQGRVVEAGTGTPIAGARVEAGSGGDFTGRGHRSALTDNEGRFRIRGLDPGRYTAEATSAHRWGKTSASTLLGLAETSAELLIEMHATLSVAGRVLLDGKGKSDCEVSLSGPEGFQEERTDETGAVVLDGLFPGKYKVDVRCQHAASEDSYPSITIGDKAITGLVWKVSAGLAVSGTVVDAADQPIAGAEVTMRTAAKGTAPRARMHWEEATTDKTGRFHIRGVVAGPYTLLAESEGVSLKDPIDVKVDHDVDGLRVVLPSSGTVEGSVVDSTGAPVGGMTVSIRGDRGTWRSSQTTTKDDGTFVSKSIPAGEYRVTASRGYSTSARAPGTSDDDVQGSVVTVAAGKAAHVKLTIESERGEIHGKVVAEDGDIITDAFVEAQRESNSAAAAAGAARRSLQWSFGGSGRTPVLTGTDGTFTLTKLAPGTYTVRAYRKGGGETVAESVAVGADVTLTFKTDGSLAGIVKDAKGNAPERFTVSVQEDRTGVSRLEQLFRTGGKWRIGDLPEGDYHLVASTPDGRVMVPMKLGKGEKRDGIALTIESMVTVRGRVVTLDTGAPVPGMNVHAGAAKGGNDMTGMFMDNAEGDHKYVTDADGRFELDHVTPGNVTITAFPRDFGTSEYTFIMTSAKIAPAGVTELPPLRAAKRRAKGSPGDLGFVKQQRDPSADLDESTHIVKVVRPNSPASAAGLVVGDEIVTVDGEDVTGANAYLFDALTRAPEGTSLTLGLRRGASLTLVLGKSLRAR